MSNPCKIQMWEIYVAVGVLSVQQISHLLNEHIFQILNYKEDSTLLQVT